MSPSQQNVTCCLKTKLLSYSGWEFSNILPRELCWDIEWDRCSILGTFTQNSSNLLSLDWSCWFIFCSCSLIKLVARVLHVDTPNNENYHPMWMANGRGTTSLVFRVKAKSDATIYLAEYQGVSLDSAYQIVIGGYTNTKYVFSFFLPLSFAPFFPSLIVL